MKNTDEVSVNDTKHMSALDMIPDQPTLVDLKVYKRRIWMLFLFSSLSMLSAMMFTHYTSMANVSSCFYGVSNEAIDWTANIFLVVYIVLVFPVASLIDYMDLRWTILCASLCSTAASATQFATMKTDSFPYVMLSSFFASLSNIFILGIPPFLAAKWFPSNELSRACAFGVFGNQLGVALGFIFSPLMISSDCSQKDLISIGKRNVAYILIAANVIIFILVTFTFQNAPKIPPSLSQAQRRSTHAEPYTKVVLKMIKNVNFGLIFIMYGLMVGSYFALSTTLNDMILRFFPNKELDIGWMGLTFIMAGLAGSIIAGYILDYSKNFKETAQIICLASFFSFILFSGLLLVNSLWLQFLSLAIFGFFLMSFLPIGFEYGLEMTYPLSESVCACLLNASTTIFGLILTEVVSRLLDSQGPIFSNIVLGVALFICCVISCFISRDYRRTKHNGGSKSVLTN